MESFKKAADTASAEAKATVVQVEREEVSGDVAHYTVVLRLGDTPNAEIAVHRVVREGAAWVAQKEASAIVLLHGDFATFPSNFLPPAAGPEGDASHGLAGYLATNDIDVWGIDRRWAHTPADATDVSDFATMGLAEELDDTGRALAFVRSLRAQLGPDGGPIILGGFSHGAQIAYEYAGVDSQKPAEQRHIKGLVPLDIYDKLAAEDETFRKAACDSRDAGQMALKDGTITSDNSFFSDLGEAAEKKPDDTSKVFTKLTNQAAMFLFLGATWQYFAPTEKYHLAGGVVMGDNVTSMRFSPEARLEHWLEAAPPFQPTLEGVDLDSIWCGEMPRPVPDHLADIQVPLFYIGAAGAFGARGLYTTTLVGSKDVKTLVVSKLPAAQEAEDFGHGDLLYSDDAPTLAWQPLADWLKSH